MAISFTGGIEPKALLPSLVGILADGQPHSGESLAGRLGVSRAAVRSAVQRLRDRGIDVLAASGRGYTLARPVELLNEHEIRGAIAATVAPRVRRLDLKFDVDSTSTRLLAEPPPPCGQSDVMLSELQHAGRGRRGRRWAAPFGGSIAVSMGWSFNEGVRATPALSLCVAVAVSRALARAGALRVGVKWPNDLWLNDRKLGGVLLELQTEPTGLTQVVIGIGLNVTLSAPERAQIEASGARIAALADACAKPPSRNFIAGAIISELLSMLLDFERDGFAAFREAWTALDALRDRPVQVVMDDAVICGTARGVDAQGALRLETDGRMQTFVSGEASLRLG